MEDVVGAAGTEGRGGAVLFAVDNEWYSLHVANDLATRREAYRFMYEVYEAKGYGQPHRCRMWFSIYEMLPTTLTLVVRRKGAVVAAATLTGDSCLGLPADEIYGPELDRRRGLGQRLTEVMSMGVRRDLRSRMGIVARLVNFVCLTGRYVQHSTDFVITVVPQHASFYENMMRFERFGQEGFHKKTGVRCVMLTLSLDLFARLREGGEQTRTVYRYYVPRDQETDAISTLAESVRQITPAEVRSFLAEKPEIWERASPAQKDALSKVVLAGQVLGSEDGGWHLGDIDELRPGRREATEEEKRLCQSTS
jgi:hypothetical protein